MDIGKRIRTRRLELGLKQEELAAKIGYKSKSTINKIELGINDIPLSKVKEFAAALSTTESHLMGWDNDPLGCFTSVYGQDSVDLMQRYLQLDASDRIRIRERIDMLLEDDKYRDGLQRY